MCGRVDSLDGKGDKMSRAQGLVTISTTVRERNYGVDEEYLYGRKVAVLNFMRWKRKQKIALKYFENSVTENMRPQSVLGTTWSAPTWQILDDCTVLYCATIIFNHLNFFLKKMDISITCNFTPITERVAYSLTLHFFILFLMSNKAEW